MNELILVKDDTIKAMERLIEQKTKIDLVVCDLPYGLTFAEWDKPIDLVKLWDCYSKLVKESGAIILFGTQPFTTDLINAKREWYRYELIWEKEQGTNPLLTYFQPLRCHENISVFYQKPPVYNPQKTKGKPFKGYNGTNKLGESYGDVVSYNRENTGDRHPRSVLYHPKDEGLHPNQKPLSLVKYLVATYSNENDWVLDNTMGSGTTGVACMQLNRNFVGIELNDKHFITAHERINAEKNQLKLKL